MNLRHIIIFLLSLSVLAGCKKDDLSDVDLMMEGDPIIDIDDYVAIGSEWALEAGGITKPEEGVGYFWTRTILRMCSVSSSDTRRENTG